MALFPLYPGEHMISAVLRRAMLSCYPSRKQYLTDMAFTCKFPKAGSACADTFGFLQEVYACENETFANWIKHTPASLWRISEDDRTLLKSVKSGRCSNVKNGVLGFSQLWHFCPRCIKDDKQTYGVSYWHESHQVHSVTHCYIHGAPLLIAPKMRNIDQLLLPHQVFQLGDYTSAFSHPALRDWDDFVLSIHEKVKKNSELGCQLRKQVEQVLTLPDEGRTNRNLAICDAMLKDFEASVHPVILKHLFHYYGKETPTRRFSIMSAVMLSTDKRTVMHPVFLLIMLYWLQNRSIANALPTAA
jgi:hypothetical protein